MPDPIVGSTPESKDPQPDWIRVGDVPAFLECQTGLRWSPGKVRRLIQSGKLPTYSILGDRVVAKSEIKAAASPALRDRTHPTLEHATAARRARADAAAARMATRRRS